MTLERRITVAIVVIVLLVTPAIAATIHADPNFGGRHEVPSLQALGSDIPDTILACEGCSGNGTGPG